MRRGEAGHYLRSPLTVVKGVLELLLRRWDRLDDEQRREYVSQALKATNRVIEAVAVVENKILHNDNITVVVDESELTPRDDENSNVQEFRVL